MRYGVLADIHANAFALRAAIRCLQAMGVDEWLCAGDIVGYGPQPDECVRLLGVLGARCVAGNHELLVLERLAPDRSGRLARETTPWTRAALTDDSRAYLAALPTMLRLPGLVLAHGSLTDVQEYVTRDEQAARQLAMLDDGDAVLVLGHTHRPWMFGAQAGTVAPATDGATPFPPAGRLLLNPGSVGQSRQAERWPRARFLMVDLERRQVRFFAEPYDVDGARAALREHGLPRSAIHVPPGRLWAVQRRTRALLRSARRRVGI
jgi:predicted phosphodiesterase